MIRLVLGKLAHSEGNALRLYLGIYSIQEGGTETRLHSHHTVPPPGDTKRHLPHHSPHPHSL